MCAARTLILLADANSMEQLEAFLKRYNLLLPKGVSDHAISITLCLDTNHTVSFSDVNII